MAPIIMTGVLAFVALTSLFAIALAVSFGLTISVARISQHYCRTAQQRQTYGNCS
jgi:hypothetical protein